MPQLETILSVSPKEGVDVWNLNTGTHLRAIQLPAQSGAHGPILIDEEHVVIPQYDKALMMVINWKSGVVKLRSHIAEFLKPLALSHDGQYLVGGSASGRVYIWHIPTGECVNTFEAHYKGISSIAFTDDDAFLLTGGDDGILNVWIFGSLLEAEDVFANKLASSSYASGSSSRLPPFIEFSNHSLPITNIICGVNSSGGGKIVTSSLDRTVKVYNLASKTMTSSHAFPTAVTCIAMDPAEAFLCAGCVDHNVYKVLLLSQQQRDEGSVGASSALPALFANMQAKSTKSKDKLPLSGAWPGAAWSAQRDLLVFEGHSKEVTSLSLSLNGTTMCSSAMDGTVSVWDVPTRTLIRTLRGNRATVGSVRIICDAQGGLNVRHDSMTKKTFPHFLKHVTAPMPLTAAMDTLRPGLARGTIAFAQLHGDHGAQRGVDPLQPADAAAELTIGGTHALDDASWERVGEGMLGTVWGPALIDADLAVAAEPVAKPAAAPVVNKKRKQGAAVPASIPAESTESKTVAELEAEVKKWKATAGELYKKLNKK